MESETPDPVRRTLARLTPPFWVYVTGTGTLYPVPHRYRPQGTAVKIARLRLVDPHTLTGVTEDGRQVNFGGPNARHWVIVDPDATPPKAPEMGQVKERRGSRGGSHYLNRMSGSLRKWTIEAGRVSRAIKVADDRIQRYQEEIAAEKTRKNALLLERQRVMRNLRAAKARDAAKQKAGSAQGPEPKE